MTKQDTLPEPSSLALASYLDSDYASIDQLETADFLRKLDIVFLCNKNSNLPFDDQYVP